MPGGAVSFTTRTSATVGNAVEEKGVVTIAPGKLKNGSNVLAVEVHPINKVAVEELVMHIKQFKLLVSRM